MKKQRFIKQSVIAAPPKVVFALHEEPGFIGQLIPPWERVRIIESPAGLQVGRRAVLRIGRWPLTRIWIAEHTEYEPPHLFADIQRRGPFAHWYHWHLFEPTGQGATRMTDKIEYILPLGRLGVLLTGALTRRKLQRLFDYRHRKVAEKIAGRQERDP